MKQVTLSIEVLELSLEAIVNQKKSLFKKKKQLKEDRDEFSDNNDFGFDYQCICSEIDRTTQKIAKLIDAEIDIETQLSKVGYF